MNVLTVGTDRNIFKKESAAQKKVIEYGSLFNELHIIVFSLRSHRCEPLHLGANVWVYPTNSFSRFLYIIDAVWMAWRKFRSLSQQSRCLVVSAQDPFESGIAALCISVVCTMKLHIQVHTDFLSPHYCNVSLLNRIRVIIARHTIPRAQSIRVVSERIAQSLQSSVRISANITVLPIFVDSDKVENAPVAPDVGGKYTRFSSIILIASRLEPEKNLFFAFDVLKQVIDRAPRVGVVVVGEGSLAKALQSYAVKCGISDNVIFEGWKEDLGSYLKIADIFLLTSLYEGYGMTLIEAALSRCPIVTSDVGIAGYTLTNNESAKICPVNDSDCFLSSIKELLHDEAARKELGKKAYSAVKANLTERDNYLKLYKQTIEAACRA